MNKFQISAVSASLLFSQFLILQTARAKMLYPVEVNHQPTKVNISNLNVKKEDGLIVVSGVVKRRSYNSHVLPGHLDLLALDSKNEIILQAIINVSGLNLRHNRFGRQFRITLDNNLPEGAYIKLGWHHNKSSQLTNKSLDNRSDSLL